MQEHPFDRYRDFTDLKLLKEFSEKPLRKCIRVNTLKMSVDDFKTYAQKKRWQLEDVPWCSEGFFIDREDRSEPLGKDILHMLGHTYMQEASSMLPVTLLDPQPGERVLDMAAAPGSKSTQIADRMQNTGVLVANDMQEARLKTLRTALNRLGIVNTLITKKMGQWFGSHMTARFDRVLIDAPCTGQGTCRKDPTALKYCSEDSIGKNAKLQRELLESAIHATKIGGRIVYSTCTLTPEENEEAVMSVLRKFEGLVEVLDPRDLKVEKAIQDSIQVQKHLFPLSSRHFPFLRIWPQTYNTEGFFCAVLTKTGPTRDIEKHETVKMKEEWLPKPKTQEVQKQLLEHFGTTLMHEDEILLQHDERLWLTRSEMLKFPLPTLHRYIGLPFGKVLRDGQMKLDQDILTLRGNEATKNVLDLTEDQWKQILRGQDIDCDSSLEGHILLRFDGIIVGRGKARDSRCKNHIPRWIIQLQSN